MLNLTIHECAPCHTCGCNTEEEQLVFMEKKTGEIYITCGGQKETKCSYQSRWRTAPLDGEAEWFELEWSPFTNLYELYEEDVAEYIMIKAFSIYD